MVIGRSRPNILTLILDCARAKNFAFSGGGSIARTPNLDALSDRGCVFPRAVAPSNWTVPSHFSILTGTYPNTHGVRSYERPSDPPVTTATELSRLGYDTSIFSENHLVGGFGLEAGFSSRSVGSARGWDEELTGVGRGLGVVNAASSGGVLKLISHVPALVAPFSFVHRRQEVSYKRVVSSDRILADFESWIRARDSTRPFYTFMNWLDTHDPYDLVPNGSRVSILDRAYLYSPRIFLLAIPELRERGSWEVLVRGYVRSIEQADEKLGRLLSLLDRNGELRNTMIIVTADHGQAFGEAGSVYHGSGAADSVLRVPLVVAPPRGSTLVRQIGRWISVCNVHSWCVAAGSGSMPFDQSGVAPAPFDRLAPDPSIVYAEGAPPSDHLRSARHLGETLPWNHRLLAAYRDDQKLVLDLETGGVRVWNFGGDPDEASIDPVSPATARELMSSVFDGYLARDELRSREEATRPARAAVAVDERLRAWGYD